MMMRKWKPIWIWTTNNQKQNTNHCNLFFAACVKLNACWTHICSSANIHIHHKFHDKKTQSNEKRMLSNENWKAINKQKNCNIVYSRHNARVTCKMDQYYETVTLVDIYFFPSHVRLRVFVCCSVLYIKERIFPTNDCCPCRYFSLAKRYNIIIIIVRICETSNVSNDNWLTMNAFYFNGYTNTKNILASNTKPVKRKEKKRVLGIVHGTITTITSSITPNEWIETAFFLRHFSQSLLA